MSPDPSHTSVAQPPTFSFILPPSHPFTGLNFTSSVQGLTLVHVRYQLEQLQDTFMS